VLPPSKRGPPGPSATVPAARAIPTTTGFTASRWLGFGASRSEERRVGKECRYRWAPDLKERKRERMRDLGWLGPVGGLLCDRARLKTKMMMEWARERAAADIFVDELHGLIAGLPSLPDQRGTLRKHKTEVRNGTGPAAALPGLSRTVHFDIADDFTSHSKKPTNKSPGPLHRRANPNAQNVAGAGGWIGSLLRAGGVRAPFSLWLSAGLAVANLLAEIALGLFDPRVRQAGAI